MAKQSKNSNLNGEVKAFKEQMDVALKPLGSTGSCFAPYVNNGYGVQYSSSLLEKANALANTIWKGQDGYNASLPNALLANTRVTDILVELNRIFSFNNGNSTAFEYHEVNELIRKLKRLENKHDADELIDGDARDQIINNIFAPTHLYGGSEFGGFAGVYLNPRQQMSVMTGILTADEITFIQQMVSYIGRIRFILADFKSADSQAVSKDLLLFDWSSAAKKYLRLEDDRRTLNYITNLATFFNIALPFDMRDTLLPGDWYTAEFYRNLDNLTKASTALRDTVVWYVREQKALSDLLEKINDINGALLAYFTTLVARVGSGFNMIDRLGLSFETFVKESEQLIVDSYSPF